MSWWSSLEWRITSWWVSLWRTDCTGRLRGTDMALALILVASSRLVWNSPITVCSMATWWRQSVSCLFLWAGSTGTCRLLRTRKKNSLRPTTVYWIISYGVIKSSPSPALVRGPLRLCHEFRLPSVTLPSSGRRFSLMVLHMDVNESFSFQRTMLQMLFKTWRAISDRRLWIYMGFWNIQVPGIPSY